ncbi:MAG: sigma 54-dependent Fis family transcriptional regulator [Myxococcales bacterium]|nr:sigma 54-dependent Fis family transcriptional regulator [Myxococcales bacterium]
MPGERLLVVRSGCARGCASFHPRSAPLSSRRMQSATRTLTAATFAERYTLPKYRLRVTAGPSAGLERVFDRRLVYIGSAPDNDLVLDDPSVSRNHMKIDGERTGYRIKDLESKNGTWFAGARLVEAVLGTQAVLRLGQTELHFEHLPELHEVALAREPQFGDLLGTSPEMREIFAILARAAPAEATVLVDGESGTGKELVAEALHQHSRRAQGPFVVFDCSAVQRDLVESELFGHVKGAFTGALATRRGAMADAQGGTLFLDEIGELELDVQPKLLRALEKREIKPVGSNERVPVDVRIVAATNRDLQQMVREGSFREDLYYRLAVLRVQLPPLRRRRTDIPLLVNHFLESAQVRSGRAGPMTVSFDTMQQLQSYAWPGNVRELRNHIERAAVLSEGRELEVQLEETRQPRVALGGATDLGELAVDWALPFKDAKSRLIERFERVYWQRALDAHQWNVSGAARATGLHRKSLEYLMKKLDLKRPDEA